DRLKGDALTAWGGIVDALKVGDLGLAMKIAWALAKVSWYEALAALRTTWLDFTGWFNTKWDESTSWIAKQMVNSISWIEQAWESLTWDNIWGAIQAGWKATVNFVSDLWDGTIKFMGDLWTWLVDSLKSGWGSFVDWLKGKKTPDSQAEMPQRTKVP